MILKTIFPSSETNLMASANFSASMMVGALRLPLTMLGITLASTTRSPSNPCTFELMVNHNFNTIIVTDLANIVNHSHVIFAHLAGARGMVRGVALGAHKRVQVSIALNLVVQMGSNR